MHVRVATAPVSWGVLMKDTPNVPPYNQVLDEIREAGYVGTELGPYGYLPFEIPKLRDELERRGLTLISAFTIFNFSGWKRGRDRLPGGVGDGSSAFGDGLPEHRIVRRSI